MMIITTITILIIASIYTWETITVTGRHGTAEEEKGLSSGRIVQLQEGPTIWNFFTQSQSM